MLKKLISFLLMIGLLLTFYMVTGRHLSKQKQKYRKAEINSVVVEKKWNFITGDNSFNYITKSGDLLLIAVDENLEVGDSIVKAAESRYANVYRMNKENRYELISVVGW